MKNKFATLNITESINNFQTIVKRILEISDIENWDGKTFLEKEQKIREEALVLAGECVCLLLHKLSKSKQAEEIAILKTKGWWQSQSARNGRYCRKVKTLGNVSVCLELTYVLERRREVKKKKSRRNQGFFPFLRWLGISQGITPLVWSNIAKYGTNSSSFEAANKILIDWGINISTRRIESLTYNFGKIGLSLRQSKLFALSQGNLIQNPIFKDQRVVISVDGGRAKIRTNKKGKPHSKTKRHRYIGEWVEPKLLTIYAVDEKGKKIKNTEIPVINDGTFEDYKGFLKLLEMYLIYLGVNQAKQVLFIADAAEWMWKHIPPLIKRLSCPLSTYNLLDFYHVAEHLNRFADAAFTEDTNRIKWFKKSRRQLKKGDIKNLLKEMNLIRKNTTGENLKVLNSEFRYLLRAYRHRRLNYAQIVAQNLPIGSGAIESLIRQVVNLRIKGNGKFWLRSNAEIMLHSRCQWVAGNWNKFCNSILTCFLNPGTTG
ncbi:MAG: ISLre2 family transposase [Mastigocoleus sp. MO_167.B18]|nr:ISLre2 family transposase [Mastigocoleus sp. MO_167.B18]